MENNGLVKELFIVGNGLDLKAGLQSTYQKFLFSVGDYSSDSNNTEVQDEHQIFEDIPGSYLDLYSHSWWSIRGELASYHVRSDVNVWYQIFIQEKMYGEIRWSDVESMIAKYLKDKNIVYNIAAILSEQKQARVDGKIEKYRVHPNLQSTSLTIKEDYQFIAKLAYILLSKTEESIKLKNWDIYNELQEYYKSGNDNDIGQFEIYVSDVLFMELLELENDFQNFLSNLSENNWGYIQKIDDILATMIDPNQDVHLISEIPYHLLSFNYTTPWKLKYKPKRVLSVHGSLKTLRYENESTVIFGVDHSLFEAGSLEYRFTKTYRTLRSYSRDLDNTGNSTDIYCDSIETIKFYGHSLAEADYAYFQQLFDYYNLYGNPKLKLVFYYSVYESKSAREIETEQLEAITRLIEKYGRTMDNKDHGKNLLTRLIQTNRLKLIQI